LLRTHVRGRARDRSRTSRGRLLGDFRQAEIQQLDDAVGRNLDVPRLQVAMNAAFFVRGFERSSDLSSNPERLGYRQRASSNPIRQRRSVHQLHHEIVGSNVVQLADIRMIHGSDGPRFRFEAFAEPRRRDFDRDFSVQPSVSRAIDLAHSAGRQELIDPVWAETVAWFQQGLLDDQVRRGRWSPRFEIPVGSVVREQRRDFAK
jgi:hypothetical protein